MLHVSLLLYCWKLYRYDKISRSPTSVVLRTGTSWMIDVSLYRKTSSHSSVMAKSHSGKRRSSKKKKIVTSFLSDLKSVTDLRDTTADSRQQQQHGTRFGDGFSPSKNTVWIYLLQRKLFLTDLTVLWIFKRSQHLVTYIRRKMSNKVYLSLFSSFFKHTFFKICQIIEAPHSQHHIQSRSIKISLLILFRWKQYFPFFLFLLTSEKTEVPCQHHVDNSPLLKWFLPVFLPIKLANLARALFPLFFRQNYSSHKTDSLLEFLKRSQNLVTSKKCPVKYIFPHLAPSSIQFL